MERLDGKEKWSVVESPRERRSIQTLVQNEAVFVQYLDVGLWHLAFYNDGKDKEMVSFNTVVLGRSGAPEGKLSGRDGNDGGSPLYVKAGCIVSELALTAREFHGNQQESVPGLRISESDSWGRVPCSRPEVISCFSIAVANAMTKATCRKKG